MSWSTIASILAGVGGLGTLVAVFIAWRYSRETAGAKELARDRAARLIEHETAAKESLSACVAGWQARLTESRKALDALQAARDWECDVFKRRIDAYRAEIAGLEADLAVCTEPAAVLARVHRLLQEGPGALRAIAGAGGGLSTAPDLPGGTAAGMDPGSRGRR